jgi:hypothetical protein
MSTFPHPFLPNIDLVNSLGFFVKLSTKQTAAVMGVMLIVFEYCIMISRWCQCQCRWAIHSPEAPFSKMQQQKQHKLYAKAK